MASFTNGPSPVDLINSGHNEGPPDIMAKPNGEGAGPPPGQVRPPPPPLQRADSRNYIQNRPPFPNLNQIRNQQPLLQRPPPPPGGPPPPPGQAFIRTTAPGSRPQLQAPFPPRPPNFIRPQQPALPRLPLRPNLPPPQPQQPQLQLQRSQTVDEEPKSHDYANKAYIATMKNRSYSVSSNNPSEQDERRSMSSAGSMEAVERPESRADSRMDKISESEPKPLKEQHVNNQTSESRKEVAPPVKPVLDLQPQPKPKKEGDNDSGVDESTQGNDQSSNGDHSSPRKSAGKSASARTASATPTKNRSLSRGSKSPSLKSPDSTATTPGAVEKKKLPMNKVQVGAAPSPNLKTVRSKIGSLENASYKPGGGKVKIESKKVDFKGAGARIEAKNEKYVPRGGDKKIQQQKLQWNAKSKIGSLENTTHKPKGGDKKIETVKLDFKEKAKPKVGSKDNMKHVPGGGDVKIENKKIELKVQSKVGSLDNVKHKPGGGEKKIFDDKEYLKQMSTVSSENHSLSGSQHSLPSQPESQNPVADENLNQEH